jgi:hypothetical protein
MSRPTWKTLTFFGLAVLSVLIASVQAPMVAAQCGSQPPTGPISFPPNTTVYYTIDPNANIPPSQQTTDPTPQAQIAAALQAWSTANSQPGGDGITFAPVTANNPATLTITTDNANSPGGPAATTTPNSGVLGPSNPATITFHTSQTNSAGNPILDPSQPDYGTAFVQTTLHEAGHLQGIGDYLWSSWVYAGTQWPTSIPLPGPNTSVMIPFWGVNDINNTSPKTGPTTCDTAQATTTSQQVGVPPTPPTPPAPSSPPTSGGGGGGGGGADGGGGGGGGGGGYGVYLLYWTQVTTNLYDEWGNVGGTTTCTNYYYSDGHVVHGGCSTVIYEVDVYLSCWSPV